MDLTGLWRSRGYGWLLEFHARGYTLHHASRVNVLAAEHGSLAGFHAAYDIVEATPQRLVLRQAGDLTAYRFEPLADWPALPRIAAPGAQRDAPLTFETLWHWFDEHYAFFELHGADWTAAHARLAARVHSGMDDAALASVCEELLLPLDDGHVSLAAGERSIQCLRHLPLRHAVQRAFGMPTPRVSPRSTMDAVAAQREAVLLQPFDATRTPLRTAGNGVLGWCELAHGVGYLSVLRLFGFADSDSARRADDLPHGRAEVARFLREDIAALDDALDDAFRDLGVCRTLLLDLRINGGGFDRCGLAIANRLAGARRLAFSKQARDGGGWTVPQAVELQPEQRPGFDGPVAVLVSPLCVSAGEVLTLALRALPQVRVLGMPTAGMLSDNLNKPLPNGWELSLSNEIYRAHDGAVFEGRGIEPDVPLVTLDEGDAAAALRTSLAQAVQMLE